MFRSKDVADFPKQAVNDFKVIGADGEVQWCFSRRVVVIGMQKKLVKLLTLIKYMHEDEHIVATTGEV